MNTVSKFLKHCGSNRDFAISQATGLSGLFAEQCSCLLYAAMNIVDLCPNKSLDLLVRAKHLHIAAESYDSIATSIYWWSDRHFTEECDRARLKVKG